MDLTSSILFFLAIVIAGCGGAVLANPFLKALVLQSFTGKQRFVILLGGAKPNLAFSIVKFPIGTNPVLAKFSGQEMTFAPNPNFHKSAWNVMCGLFDPADCRQVPFETLSYFWEFDREGKSMTREVDLTLENGQKGKVVIETPKMSNNLKILGKMYDPSQMGALQNKYFSWEKNKALKDLQKNPIYTWLPWVGAFLALVAVLVSLYNVSLTNGLMNQVTSLPGTLNQTIGVVKVG